MVTPNGPRSWAVTGIAPITNDANAIILNNCRVPQKRLHFCISVFEKLVNTAISGSQRGACSALEIMSISGHTDIREVKRYCREAAKKGPATKAMDKLQGGFDTDRLPNLDLGLGETDDIPLNLLAVLRRYWIFQNRA